MKYRVINAQKKLAEAYGVDSRKARTLKVAAAVTISGEKVSVTSIAAKHSMGMKKLEKVTIGTNVSKIGKNAFSGDSKLKSHPDQEQETDLRRQGSTEEHLCKSSP